jgi:hypothetical protein
LENKRAEQVLPGSMRGSGQAEGGGGQRGEVAQTMYRHMNKCKNSKKNLIGITLIRNF